ncbi:8255_t:CDS:1, partial [Funneliformis caledonium]
NFFHDVSSLFYNTDDFQQVEELETENNLKKEFKYNEDLFEQLLVDDNDS